MATESGYERQILDWFKKQTFEKKEEVLNALQQDLAAAKGKEIAELEAKLAALRGDKSRMTGSGRGHALKGIKVPPKYRDSEGNTWSGRGVQPNWVREYLKKRGHKLDDLLIK